jgi:Fur family ferric uptake transcriptional regulator/Fur family peroxide stress response transcriptional regulator
MDAINLLIRHDIKPSLQRLAVMDYMLTHATHPTVDEIYHALAPSIPTLSKTTVYNTLKLFEDQGVITYLGIDSKNARFDGNMKPHGHFRCKECGSIYDVWSEQPAVEKLEGLEDVTVTEVHTYYKGYCKSCHAKIVTN